MDQDAFRSLLSAPRQASSSSRTVLGGPAPKRGWGLKQKQGPRNEKPKDEPTSSAPAFAPRQHRKRQEQNGEAASSAYKDRAAMRRQGVDDEYKGVEKLLEDFERRKAEAGEEDADKIEATRAYLGGDAEHSILVKGLDYALLAARKAELAREQDEGMEDELEELGRGLGRKPEGKSKGKEQVKPEEKLGNRFKSIAQRKVEEEAAKGEKKKKTRKKKKDKRVDDVSQAPAEDTSRGPIKEEAQQGDEPPMQPTLPMPAAKAPTPEPETEEDIFADAGMYDLGAGGESDGDEAEEKNEAIGIPTKLVPLSSSAMADVGGFLAAEASAAKAEQRRIKKAQWRARQGLATQEGTDMEQLTEGKRLDDKQKQNREYQLVMNQMKKEGGGEGGAGVGPSSKPAQ
ncbi:hypothetical protein EHS25_000530 [Saitozyma podzolica]|uniref:RED-like N-terminal domain-containing protein n=1 Tax=Saitozyma podzolica TaxID=1890683 RepID=A0A427YWD8_9TREE|nr:hypothetical protein EHS25_000530 [Saitozyma podzolica]